jgi:hypothetical protein
LAASGAGIVKRSKLAQGIELEGYLNVGLGRSCAVAAGDGIVRANSVTLPKRQNRISRSLIFLHFSGSI